MKYSAIPAALALAFFVAGCAQHEDTPTKYSFIPAPKVSNVEVTGVQDEPGVYDITWDVNDDTAVANYRVYIFDPFSGVPELVGEPTTTSAQVVVGLEIGGLAFGVTAVTVENVEGAMAVGLTPAP